MPWSESAELYFQKKWLKVVVNHKNLAFWRAGEGSTGSVKEIFYPSAEDRAQINISRFSHSFLVN